ncbi:Leo1-like protein [Metarhizium album ARSEF 1941]|uniref:Leo1-like protein n=1 Tax=Metarhizium album (strain ARSEF 1941) TaxID=1081103 RepID=A0A0B2WV83_METAS|nr:Leo1-like protein [Metarhizium album ARSEF 1941]KHO00022.1 Leo1-like protein [Metarhizium album ARSEF 1941]
MSDSEDSLGVVDETAGDDLFGDEGDEEPRTTRVLDDDELASDPDYDADARRRGYDDEDGLPRETRDRVVMAVQTYRHQIPKPKDGITNGASQLRVMRVPKFIKFMPEEYVAETFQPSDFDLDNAKSDRPKHVARIRKDASTGYLQSNTNIYRWSDGSLTISVGGEHYEIQKKALAPGTDQPYNELRDGHHYAAAAELGSNILLTVGHLTEQFNVRPNKAVGDDALSVLAERMAQASKAANDGDMIIRTTRDPELQKKQAEMAEKERMKAQRRRENAALKMDGGLGRSGRGGLSIRDLEGGRGFGSGRKRGMPESTKPKRRRPEYDSDDDLPQGVGRREDYDLDDGFLVGSDEEEMDSAAEDEEEDLLDDDEEERPPRSKRQRTRDPDEDEDAEGDEVEPGEPSGRTRRRNIVDEDEEE